MKSLTLSIPLMAATVALAPVAHAHMPYGSSQVQSHATRATRGYGLSGHARQSRADCLQDHAQPRPNGQATPWRRGTSGK